MHINILMKALFTTLTCIGLMTAQAQLTKPAHKLILFSGEQITGESLVYESPILRQPYFTMSDESYESPTVAFFQNSHGYFANLCKIHGLNSERYAMRIKLGKINFFEEVDLSVYGGETLKIEGTNNNQDPMLASGDILEYYTKGDSPIRAAKYKNLVVDLNDNANSMSHLKRYRNYKILQWSMIGVGSGIIAANIISQSNSSVKFNPVMAIGIAIGGGSYLMEKPKEEELWIAVEDYNKEPEVLSER